MNKNRRGNANPKRDNGEKAMLTKRLERVLDVPADLLRGGCYMELRGQSELYLQGCRRIDVYSSENIVLRLRRGCVRVKGCRLICTSYHAGRIVINGWIMGIDFSETEGAV